MISQEISDSTLHYPFLPENKIVSKKILSIVIVSPEIVGPFHGGIGTAYDALARALAEDEHKVTLCYIPGGKVTSKQSDPWIKDYRSKGINLVILPDTKNKSLLTLWSNASRSYQVMQWLKDIPEPDVVHFPDWKGLGYFSLLAKKQGLGFQDTIMVVENHSTTFWDACYSLGEKSYYQDFLERNYLETESVRLADYDVSPSQYFLNWLEKKQNCQREKNTFVQQNILISDIPKISPNRLTQQFEPLKELVFFGRIEMRKGVILFCDALDFPDIRDRNEIIVSFLGNCTFIEGINAQEYLEKRGKNWKFKWRVLPRMKRDEALQYLKSPGRMAVIPSLSDNLPYTVLECLWSGIPFLASRVGGIPELIHPDDLERSTFDLSSNSLKNSLKNLLESGILPSRPAIDFNENKKRWKNWHYYITQTISEEKKIIKYDKKLENIKLSIILLMELENSINNEILPLITSIKNQSFQNYEVIFIINKDLRNIFLLEDHLKSLDFNGKNSKIIFANDLKHEEYLALAYENSNGNFLLFIGLNSILKKEAIHNFLSVLNKTDADIVTCAEEIFNSDISKGTKFQRYIHFYLGNSFPLGFLHNVFGGETFLIKKNIYKELNKIKSDYIYRDFLWKFYAKASLNDYRIESIPFPLVETQVNEKLNPTFPLTLFDDHHPYLENVPIKFRELLSFIQATRFFNDPAPDGFFPDEFVNRPQTFINYFWDSKMWGIYLKISNSWNLILGRPNLVRPHIKTMAEALRNLRVLHNSIPWHIGCLIEISIKKMRSLKLKIFKNIWL